MSLTSVTTKPHSRTDDPITSKLAGHSFRNSPVLWAVYQLFKDLGPLTDTELTTRYFKDDGLPECHHDSPRKRRSDLTRAGLLHPVEMTDGPFGRTVIKWALTDVPESAL